MRRSDGPVVLLSGGVGLTPMMSMLEAIVASGSGRPTWYVHGAENGRMHAMGAHARELAAKARNVTVRTFYNAPDPQDVAGQSYDERGVITPDWLRAQYTVGGCCLLPLWPAAILARAGGRPGEIGCAAEPHSLRVLRPGGRVAGRLKRRCNAGRSKAKPFGAASRL